MSIETLLIEDLDIEKTKDICSFEPDETSRSIVAANVLGCIEVGRLFNDYGIDIDIDSGIFHVPSLSYKAKLADIYIEGAFVNVVVCIDDNLYVPKYHFDNNILPSAYLFVKLEPTLTNAEILGFVQPLAVDKTSEKNGMYIVDKDKLLDLEGIRPYLVPTDDDDLFAETKLLVYNYFDNVDLDISKLIKLLINSKKSREFLISVYMAKNVFKNSIDATDDVEYSLDAESDDSYLLDESKYSDIDFENVSILPAGEYREDDGEPLELIDNDSSDSNILDENIDNETLVEDPDTLSGVMNDFNDYTAAIDDNTFATSTTPGIGMYEEDADTADENDDSAEELIIDSEKTDDEIVIDETDLDQEENNQEEHVETIAFTDDNWAEDDQPVVSDYSDEGASSNDDYQDPSEYKEQIQDLFDESKEDEGAISSVVGGNSIEKPSVKQIQKPILPLVGCAVIAVAIGFFAYNKFVVGENPDNPMSSKLPTNEIVDETVTPEEPMPDESVENVDEISNMNTNAQSAIPVIEQNLGASISVSNLAVSWEVPAGYASNTSTKRYFTKLGKIIKLNLRAELLLATNPPLSNKIVVELEYDKSSNSFDIKGLKTSSGEKSIDDIVIRTVRNAMNMVSSADKDCFAGAQGNPLLVIKL